MLRGGELDQLIQIGRGQVETWEHHNSTFCVDSEA